MKLEYSSLARCQVGDLTWLASRNQGTQLNRRRVERTKVRIGDNPLWTITVAMAIFFAAAAAIVALA